HVVGDRVHDRVGVERVDLLGAVPAGIAIVERAPAMLCCHVATPDTVCRPRRKRDLYSNAGRDAALRARTRPWRRSPPGCRWRRVSTRPRACRPYATPDARTPSPASCPT